MNTPAATKIDESLLERSRKACAETRLKMADLLRIGLDRVLTEFETTGGIHAGASRISTKIAATNSVTCKR